MMRLVDLQTSQQGIIVKVLGHGAFRKRVMEMGFVSGKTITVGNNAPLDDPIKYRILDYEVSLRRSEAELIEVVPIDGNAPGLSKEHINTINDYDGQPLLSQSEKNVINIALIGNPNCGKTSLFNFASGSHEHVGNYSGVTVDAKEGFFEYKGYKFKAVDLPGTYSLSAYSPEELYVRRYLNDAIPDVIVNVVVASNLERNLYLTTELIDMDRSMVIALNMFDEFKTSGAKLNYSDLEKMIGVPMVPTVTKTGEGISDLFEAIISVYENRHEAVRHIHVSLGSEVEAAIKEIKDGIKACKSRPMQFSPRYLAIKLLENDSEVKAQLEDLPEFPQWIKLRNKWVGHIEEVSQEDISSIIASQKYGFIAGAMRETYEPGSEPRNVKSTDIIDTFVTHKLFGFPIFILLMWFMFWFTFQVGAYPMEWLESGVDWISSLVRDYMPEGALKDLIVDGIIGGVGGVIVFLPNIMILYFFISFMEDSGYMSRAAFIMDRIMHNIGLHGKSFIPLVMGFGCNVPAVMASRIIESRSSRIITMLIVPFMSCSARLPIFILLIGAFFPGKAAMIFVTLYLLGLCVAILTAKMLRRFYFKKDETPFVMELPPYRVPTMRASIHHMWEKGEQYLRKMTGVILFASIIVWALNYFPRDISKSNAQLSTAELQYQNEHSLLSQMGKAITPVMEPLGLNWKASVALLSGMPAKEIVVSTLGVLYSSQEGRLAERLQTATGPSGKPDFTVVSALAFMVFALLYVPCIATVVAVAKECGSWKYGAFTIVFNTLVAWTAAFLTYQIGSLFI